MVVWPDGATKPLDELLAARTDHVRAEIGETVSGGDLGGELANLLVELGRRDHQDVLAGPPQGEGRERRQADRDDHQDHRIDIGGHPFRAAADERPADQEAEAQPGAEHAAHQPGTRVHIEHLGTQVTRRAAHICEHAEAERAA